MRVAFIRWQYSWVVSVRGILAGFTYFLFYPRIVGRFICHINLILSYVG